MTRKIIAGLVFGLVLASSAFAAYPDKPIRIIVPAAAGGGSDVLARILAPKITEKLGQPVVVEDRSGASGTIGAQYVEHSEPDGYTLLLVTNQHASAASLIRNLPYDPVKDFTSVIGLVMTPMLLEVKADSPLNSVADLVKMAKDKPGTVTFGSAGVGNVSHLTGTELATQSKTQMIHVPYKGAGQATTDLLGGHVTFIFNNPVSSSAMVRSGQLKALAVSTATRLEAFPSVPTMAEEGYPSFNIGAWFGLVAPAKTPEPVIEKLNVTLNEIMDSPDMRQRFASMGVQRLGGSPQKFQEMIVKEVDVWRRLVRDQNITPQ